MGMRHAVWTMAAGAALVAAMPPAAAAQQSGAERERREIELRLGADDREAIDRYEAMIREYGGAMRIRVSVDFDGGSVRDYLDALANQLGVSNVLARGPLDRAQMAEVRLTAVPFAEAVSLAEEAELENGVVEVELGESLAVVRAFVDDLFRERVVEGQRVIEGRPTHGAAREESETLVFSFTRERSRDQDRVPNPEPTVDEALGAVEAAAAFADDDSLELSVHEETGMLFVRGSIDSLEIIERTIDALRERAARDAAREEIEIVREMELAEETEGELQELMEELERMERRVEELEAMNAELEGELDEAYARLRGRE